MYIQIFIILNMFSNFILLVPNNLTYYWIFMLIYFTSNFSPFFIQPVVVVFNIIHMSTWSHPTMLSLLDCVSNTLNSGLYVFNIF